MITGIRNKVDKLWEDFWTGGITNPLTIIEQISYLIFSRNLDQREMANEKKIARGLGKKGEIKPVFDGPEDERRWSNLMQRSPEDLQWIVRDKVFLHFRTAFGEEDSLYRQMMKDAQLMIPSPQLLYRAVRAVDELMQPQPEHPHRDIKGDIFEYVLGKLTTAGINGQFRTPRHLIEMMVAIVDPDKNDIICDPACGTGGFLVKAYEHLRKKYTSEEGIIRETGADGKDLEPIYSMNELNSAERKHVHNNMFYGFDFDLTMLRIATMNLILHGLENPNIHYCDSLTAAMPDQFPELATEYFDVILANPPFKGSLVADSVHKTLTGQVKTKKTELLFLVLMLRMLKPGGRCAVVVPDGVLFGSSTAHKDLRKQLVDHNQLEAVISLPSGVFKPYAGVSTAVLVFTKGDQTDKVFFYDVKADGFSLDDRRQPVKENDLPDVLTQWKKWHEKRQSKKYSDRTKPCFVVPREDIEANDYDLSIGRYKEHVHEEIEYEPPKQIIKNLRKLDAQIAKHLDKLEGMLK